MSGSTLEIKLEDLREIELFISLLSLGLCCALREKVVSVELAERLLYRPYNMIRLKQMGASQEAIDLIHDGTEMGDVQRLAPESADRALSEMCAAALRLIKQNSDVPPDKITWL
jgi:hypothetical protein